MILLNEYLHATKSNKNQLGINSLTMIQLYTSQLSLVSAWSFIITMTSKCPVCTNLTLSTYIPDKYQVKALHPN